TAATLVPMDAQHLPIKTLKAIRGDTTLRLEIEVPKDAEIPGLQKTPVKPTNTSAERQGDRDVFEDDDDPQQRRGGGGVQGEGDDENGDKKSGFFEYGLGTGKLRRRAE